MKFAWDFTLGFTVIGGITFLFISLKPLRQGLGYIEKVFGFVILKILFLLIYFLLLLT